MKYQVIISHILNVIMPLINGFIKPKPEKQNWYNETEEYPEKTSIIVNQIVDDKPKFNNPVKMTVPFITSPYGYRVLNHKGAKRSFHYGCDLRASHNSPAYAIEDCIIIEIVKLKRNAPCRFKYNSVTKKWVDLKNGSITPRIVYKGKFTGNIYKHKHTKPSIKLKVGQFFKSGETIGTYGNYGYSQGSHCHLEVWVYLTKVFGIIKKKTPKHALVNPRVWLEKKAKVMCTGRKRQVTYELDME